MMEINENSPEYGLRRLALKYTGAAVFVIANYWIFPYAILIIYWSVGSFVPALRDMERGSTLEYVVYLVLNDVESYLLPILLFPVIFREELRGSSERLTLYPDTGYQRFPFDVVVLYFVAVLLADIGSIATSYIANAAEALFGLPQPEMAFSDVMPPDLFRFVAFAAGCVIVAPICEEYIFRHLLLKPLRKYGDSLAVTVSALLFGISHFNFDQFLYTFLFGFGLGIIAVRSGSILPAIICHSVNNLIVSILYYQPDTFGSEALDSFFKTAASVLNTALNYTFWIGIFAILLAAGLRALNLKNNSGIPTERQFRIMFLNPAMICAMAAAFALTVMALFI